MRRCVVRPVVIASRVRWPRVARAHSVSQRGQCRLPCARMYACMLFAGVYLRVCSSAPQEVNTGSCRRVPLGRASPQAFHRRRNAKAGLVHNVGRNCA
eukprot:533-Prymnesium_polylepis.1